MKSIESILIKMVIFLSFGQIVFANPDGSGQSGNHELSRFSDRISNNTKVTDNSTNREGTGGIGN